MVRKDYGPLLIVGNGWNEGGKTYTTANIAD